MSKTQLQNPESPPQTSKQQYQNIRQQATTLRIKASEHVKLIQKIWNIKQQQLLEFFKKYETMPFTRITTDTLFKTEKIKMVRTEQKLYFGETSNKKKEGKGISIHRDGKIYEGEFHLNEKSGFAVEVYSNQNVYIGDFAQNKKHGKGSFFWFSLSNKQSKTVQQYHGDWWGGLPDGEGQHNKQNGDIYIGKFKNGLRHGQGIQTYINGDNYKGQFINGLPEGIGEYFWADGSFFKGDFKQGARNGYGIWKSCKQNGQIYKGHYMFDKKHGYGLYDWANGYLYKGFWMDDLRYGEGTLFYNDKVEYDGYWENGEKVDYKPELPKINSKYPIATQASQLEQTRTRNLGFLSRISDRKFNSQKKDSLLKNRSGQKQKSVIKQKSPNKHQHESIITEIPEGLLKGRHRNCIPIVEIGKMPKPSWKK